eukprot:gene13234-biopygen1425
MFPLLDKAKECHVASESNSAQWDVDKQAAEMEAARKTAGQNASFVGPRGEMKRDAPYYTCDGKVNLRLREGDDIVEKEKLSNKVPALMDMNMF